MWRVVNYDGKKASNQTSHRNRHAFPSANSITSALDSDGEVPVTSKQVTKLVKNLRHTACSLRSNSVFSLEKPLRFVERFVKDFLDSHLHQTTCEGEGNDRAVEEPHPKTSSFLSVRLIALGIGPFDRQKGQQQHLAGFLQMSALIALRDACQRAINSVSVVSVMSLSTSTDAKLDANSTMDAVATPPQPQQQQHKKHPCSQSKNRNIIPLNTSFYDPICNQLHSLCCQRLGIEVETNNTHGVYRPANEHQLLILFAPHCPWGLLHNFFVSNWPCPSSPVKGGKSAVNGHCLPDPPAVALRQVLLISNNLQCAPLCSTAPSASSQWSLYHEGLCSCLEVQPLQGGPDPHLQGKTRRKCRTSEVDDEDLAEEAAEATLEASPRSLRDAFSDLALMRVKGELSDAEVTARLLLGSRSRIPLTQFQEMA
ncbi:unnamed protein product [Phytomonas sp. EM1]|nr:unnamed protein product [Phytomonas sp. EM1]|eukprot:CCW62857.1 unnamed protein product [Phytomonas sp. isolate EM1]